MNKKKSILIFFAAIGIFFTYYICQNRYKKIIKNNKINVYTGDNFVIPANCKKLAFTGCTPHPSKYLKEKNGGIELLKTITLNDFLDVEYLRDSFDRTFSLCKQHEADHFLLAYLPIYYIEMHPILKEDFMQGCRIFLDRIVDDIVELMQESMDRIGFNKEVTLVIPTDYQIAHVPHELSGMDERVKYLIKELPKFKDISKSSLSSVLLINNIASVEDEKLISLLEYEYLYEKPISFDKSAIDKKPFHLSKY